MPTNYTFRQFLSEAGAVTTVYHVSPESNLIKIRPERSTANKRIGRGVFVAPKFRDALAWADSYVKHKKPGGEYKTLTIYELEVPRETVKNLHYATWWEPEYFIPEEIADQIRIVSSKTFSNKEIVQLYRRSTNIRHSTREGTDEIRRLAKTNLAARLYMDLFNMYAGKRMEGQPEQNEIKDALQNLRNMTRKPDRSGINYDTLERLDREGEHTARKIYMSAKQKLESRA